VRLPTTAAADNQLPGLFLGALLAFVAALIVQAFVIPWVVVRIRRRERWETTLIDLLSLLEEQLPRAVARFRSEADSERLYRKLTGDAAYDQQRVSEALERATGARREAEDLVEQHVTRLRSLVARICRVHRRAPYWLRVQRDVLGVRVHRVIIAPSATLDDDPLDDEKWDARWQSFDRYIKGLTDFVQPLALTMKPPPGPVQQRWQKVRRALVGRAVDAKDAVAKRIRAEWEKLGPRGPKRTRHHRATGPWWQFWR
jgi:hypothetical protein